MTTTRTALSRIIVLISLVVATSSSPRAAEGLPRPSGRVILTISGKISAKNADDTAQFDRPMLESLGLSKIVTSTPWSKGSIVFEGVLLERLMQVVGASGSSVVAIALNDYTTEIPREDFSKFNPILALKRNNNYMSVRDRGPLFIIYPFDNKPELKSQLYYGRSVWQVFKLVVK
jgi:hypothetical protein